MACAAVTLLPGHLPEQVEKAAAPASSGALGTGSTGSGDKASDWVKNLRESSMDGLGLDGKPDPNYLAAGTGTSQAY